MKLLATIRGVPVQLLDDGSLSFGPVGFTVDADGSPRAYGPRSLKTLDYLENAGHPGNWWGVATDAAGNPYVQKASDPAPGCYVSTTSYQNSSFKKWDPRRYLDSETRRFIVVPAFLRTRVQPVVLGCRAQVIDMKTGRTMEAIVGDFGPATHLGEGSIALARAFDLDPDPKRGGTDEARFIYKVFPGVGIPGYELQPA
jgi:hypothetical protein